MKSRLDLRRYLSERLDKTYCGFIEGIVFIFPGEYLNGDIFLQSLEGVAEHLFDIFGNRLFFHKTSLAERGPISKSLSK